MNKLKKNLEEYIKSGMWQYEAPYIGKDDVELILKVFNALDKACDIITDLNDCYNNISIKYPMCPLRDKCEKGKACLSDPEKWKEYLLSEVEE